MLFISRLASSSLFLFGSVFSTLLCSLFTEPPLWEARRELLLLLIDVLLTFGRLPEWTTPIVWGDYLVKLFSSSLGSIFPCFSLSIFSIMSRFCFSIYFFIRPLWCSSCSLSCLMWSAFSIFSYILFISFYRSYSWTFIILSTFSFLSVLLMISSLCFSSILCSFCFWTRCKFYYLPYNFLTKWCLYSSICFSLF